MYYNYSISDKVGQFYQKSKEPKEGYEKVTYGAENKVTYHKYTPRVSGVLKKVEIKTVPEHRLTFLEVTLKDGEDMINISTQLKRPNGNFSDSTTKLISCLYGADFEQAVTFSAKKNGEYLNIYCNYVDRKDAEDKGISTGYIPYEEIPKAGKSTDPLTGTDTYDWTKVNEFWTGKLMEVLKRGEASSNTPPATPPASTSTAGVGIPTIAGGSGLADDLPF